MTELLFIDDVGLSVHCIAVPFPSPRFSTQDSYSRAKL